MSYGCSIPPLRTLNRRYPPTRHRPRWWCHVAILIRSIVILGWCHRAIDIRCADAAHIRNATLLPPSASRTTLHDVLIILVMYRADASCGGVKGVRDELVTNQLAVSGVRIEPTSRYSRITLCFPTKPENPNPNFF